MAETRGVSGSNGNDSTEANGAINRERDERQGTLSDNGHPGKRGL